MSAGLLELKVKVNRTPDFVELKRSKLARHLVFVYDDCKRGRTNNFLMNGAEFYGMAQSFETNLCLKKTYDNMPVVLRPKKISVSRKGHCIHKYNSTGQILRPEELGKIEGEIYSVSLRHLCELDKANLNTVLFERRLMWFQFSSYPNEMKTARAWVYVAKEGAFNEKWPLNSLRHVNLLRKNNHNVHYT